MNKIRFRQFQTCKDIFVFPIKQYQKLKFKSQPSIAIRQKSVVPRKGFTVIELLIVLGIMGVLAAAAAPLYGNMQLSAQLDENISQITQTARIARERSFSRLNNSSHGIYFEINPSGNDKFILYQGDSYATRNAEYDRVFTLDPSLSLSTTIMGNEINFSKEFGIPNATGTVTIFHSVKGSRTMRINRLGMAEEE